MKKHVTNLLMSVSVLLPLLAINAGAQATSHILQVTVPFEFSVGNRQFPAGTYTVVQKGGFVSFRGEDERPLVTLVAHPVEALTPATEAKLVFYKYEGMHLLTRIWWEGDRTGVELIRPGAEVQVAKRLVPEKTASAQAAGRP